LTDSSVSSGGAALHKIANPTSRHAFLFVIDGLPYFIARPAIAITKPLSVASQNEKKPLDFEISRNHFPRGKLLPALAMKNDWLPSIRTRRNYFV
jgi:hypothetical protein